MCNNIRVKWKFDGKEIEFSSLGEPTEEPEQKALPLEAPAEAAEPEVEEVKQAEEEPKVEPPCLPALPPQINRQMSIESKTFLLVCAIIAIEALVRIAGMLGR